MLYHLPGNWKVGLPLLGCLFLFSQFSQAQQGSLKVVYAVNAGGYEHTDKNGIRYEADPLHHKIGTASDYGNHLLIIGRVPEQDEVLYRTERYHTANFGYDLPLDGDGQYALIMKFCEVYFNEPNMKVFDVLLNNQHLIVSELDIFHQVGRGTAHEEYAFFTVSQGRLYFKDEESPVRSTNKVRLEFLKGVYDNPKINAFALMKGAVENIPRLSPISDDILPMDADMAVFHDRVSADSSAAEHQRHAALVDRQVSERLSPAPPQPQQAPTAVHSYDNNNGDEEEDEGMPELPTDDANSRKTSGPRQPNPYILDDSHVILPVIVAIGAFFPFLFCLCKL